MTPEQWEKFARVLFERAKAGDRSAKKALIEMEKIAEQSRRCVVLNEMLKRGK